MMTKSIARHIACFVLGICSLTAEANCSGTFLNPITSVNWRCAFPMNIGGVISFGESGGTAGTDSNIRHPICSCLQSGGSTIIGLEVSFWEPARLIETVKDPWCFPSLGTSLPNPRPGSLRGTGARDGKTTATQSHYYIFPAWALLNMFVDVPCLAGNRVDGGGNEFDLAMITEILPTWNNDLMALLISPEALLFANPAAALACMADAAAATTGMPLNELFWCMGSWPTTYPMSGTLPTDNYIVGNAAAAGRTLFMMARNGAVLDHGLDACGSVRTTIWKKRNYRIQSAYPVRDSGCQTFGKPGVLWERYKNTPLNGDNFSWVLFRRVKCCIGW